MSLNKVMNKLEKDKLHKKKVAEDTNSNVNRQSVVQNDSNICFTNF